ncbi:MULTISPECIES: sigma-70 family RNA polymerase sigma factor [unclassified Bacillus (in: firmicutes)]|uniref:sigma-70 family RNA polymerase sigma factor n=1 Tax=unclassified Bacillus (in: firmicutes) TaxID=185979 RepID=UPI001C54E27E|nr:MULTISPECIES: sigma-70 family RNA polymerase sigma factor [unclassified Bacillus (in: firmicutes)]
MQDYSLVKRAIKGDEEAFLSIMHEHKLSLYKTALAYLKNKDEAIEAIQEVTFRAYQNIKTLREPSYVKTWLIRIMINYCQDYIKKNKRVTFDDEYILQQGTNEDYQSIEIEEAMSKLDETQRQLLHLKYFHDVKIKDIAILWNRPEGTVKTWLNKALSSLRGILEEKGENGRV